MTPQAMLEAGRRSAVPVVAPIYVYALWTIFSAVWLARAKVVASLRPLR